MEEVEVEPEAVVHTLGCSGNHMWLHPMMWRTKTAFVKSILLKIMGGISSILVPYAEIYLRLIWHWGSSTDGKLFASSVVFWPAGLQRYTLSGLVCTLSRCGNIIARLQFLRPLLLEIFTPGICTCRAFPRTCEYSIQILRLLNWQHCCAHWEFHWLS